MAVLYLPDFSGTLVFIAFKLTFRTEYTLFNMFVNKYLYNHHRLLISISPGIGRFHSSPE